MSSVLESGEGFVYLTEQYFANKGWFAIGVATKTLDIGEAEYFSDDGGLYRIRRYSRG